MCFKRLTNKYQLSPLLVHCMWSKKLMMNIFTTSSYFILFGIFNEKFVTGKSYAVVETTSKKPTCTEILAEEWSTISIYDYGQSGFLDVSLMRLNKAQLETCQNTTVFIDFFPITSKTEEETIKTGCTTLEIPKEHDEFRIMTNGSEKFEVIRRLYGPNIIRFRTCSPENHNCSNIDNNRDIRCTPVQTFKPLTCLNAMADEWDEIAIHNSTNNTLTVDTSILSSATKQLCQLDKDPVNLEIFAVSPDANQNTAAYYSCNTYSKSDYYVLPFGQNIILNGNLAKEIKYVSGSFIFRLIRGDSQACTHPKKDYKSEKAANTVSLWRSPKCETIPNATAISTVEPMEDSCKLTISSFPLLDCYLMDDTLTATIKLKMATETIKNCKDSTESEIWKQKAVHIMRNSSVSQTPLLEDATFNLPKTARFCMEVFLDYPLCPSLNVDDADKCSRPVAGPLNIRDCQKKWKKTSFSN